LKLSTATHWPATAHDTALKGKPDWSTFNGTDHTALAKMTESPSVDTATQKVAVGHETDVSPPASAVRISFGLDQVTPLKVSS
jgi:hypothetical protein